MGGIFRFTRAPRHLLGLLLFLEVVSLWVLVSGIWGGAPHAFVLLLGLAVAEACLGLSILRRASGRVGGAILLLSSLRGYPVCIWEEGWIALLAYYVIPNPC